MEERVLWKKKNTRDGKMRNNIYEKQYGVGKRWLEKEKVTIPLMGKQLYQLLLKNVE
jgi:hypothetical protein